MTSQRIENAAIKLEKTAESGDTNALQTQLNSLKPADQLVVIQEMQHISDKRREKDPQLPDIQFTEGTNDKGKAVVTGLTVHGNFIQRTAKMDIDANTGKVTAENITSPFSTQHVDLTYDQSTGKIATTRVNEKTSSGIETDCTYDAKGRAVSKDTIMQNAHFHNIYDFDEKTGKLSHSHSQTTMSAGEPSTTEETYDLKTGRATAVDITIGHSPTTHFDIDPVTGQAQSTAMKNTTPGLQ